MKLKFLTSLILLLALTFASQAAPTVVVPVEVGSVATLANGLVDSTGSAFLTGLIPADGIIFANDAGTFVVLYDSSGGASTCTVAKPTATVRTSYGDISLADITISMVSTAGNWAIIKIPERYNSSGKATITISTSDFIKYGVYRLANYPK